MANQQLDHILKYDAIIDQHGITWTTVDVRELLGIDSMEKLVKLYNADRHLNNIPLQTWDLLGLRWLSERGSRVTPDTAQLSMFNPVRKQLREVQENGDLLPLNIHGAHPGKILPYASLADAVCIHKRAVVRLIMKHIANHGR